MIDSAFTPLSSRSALCSATGPVVVLGASGLIGQAVLQVAQQRGLPVVGLSRRKREGIDLAALDALAPILTPLAPRLLINAACLSDPLACARDPGAAYAINTRLPALLARCGLEMGLRWVQVSSDQFFAGMANVLHDEYAPVQLVHEAARTRYAGEALARTDPSCLVLRTHVVGWRDADAQLSAVGPWHPLRAQGACTTVHHNVWASRMDAQAFAQALFDLVDAGAQGLLNVAARESVSQAQFAQALAAAGAWEAEPAAAQALPAALQGHVANATGLNVSKAEHWLGRRLPGTADVVAALAARAVQRAQPALAPALQSEWARAA